MGSLIGLIVERLISAFVIAIKTGRKLRDVLADTLEDSAADIRSGAIEVDDAVALAEQDQDKLDDIRDKFSQ